MRTLITSSLCMSAALVALGSGCSSSLQTLTVRRTTAAPLSLVPAPQLAERPVRRVLVLPPEEGVQVSDQVESLAAREKSIDYYSDKLEKILLAKGFEVVTSELVTRATGAVGNTTRTSAERTLAIGRKADADAVLHVQLLKVQPTAKYYEWQNQREVAPEDRAQDDDGRYFHKETEQCLFRLPMYEVAITAKLIDVQHGDVLWVGEGREKNLDALPKSWVAKLDDECHVQEQAPFNYRDYLASAEAFDSTVNDLLMRLIEPLRVRALAPPRPTSKVEPVTAAPAAAPAPVVVPAAAKPNAPSARAASGSKTATISSGRAILRDLPQDDSLKLRLVERRTKVEVLQSSGQWHKIKLDDGSTGWMHDDHILVDQ